MIDPDLVRETTDGVLRGPGYRDIPGSPLDLALEEARSWIAELLFRAFTDPSTARFGQLVAIGVVVLVLVLALVAVLGFRRTATADVVTTTGGATDPAQLVEQADDARRRGDLEAAVRARYGALVLLLTVRDVLPARPGTTVGEVDAAVRRAAPTVADEVAAAGRALADVVYGHRPAVAEDDERVAAALARVDAVVPAAVAVS